MTVQENTCELQVKQKEKTKELLSRFPLLNGFRDNLVKQYVYYHSLRTDAEIHFAILLIVQMIGHLLGYDCVNTLAPDEAHHNMYVALIGTSTLSRKSTAQRIAKIVYPQDMCHPDECSPEQLIAEMDENSGNFIWYGEWSYMLKCIGGKGTHFMSRIVEIMNHIFDCPKQYRKNLREKKGNKTEFIIKRPHLSFNTTCTEEMLIKYIDDEMVHGGFFARFLICSGKEKSDKRKRITPEVKRLQKNFQFILSKIPSLTMGTSLIFDFTDEAMQRHYELEKELSKYTTIGSFAGRCSNYLASIADIIIVAEALAPFLNNPDGLNEVGQLYEIINAEKTKDEEGRELIKVTPEYLDMAYEIIKPCLDYTRQLVETVGIAKPIAKLKRYLQKYKNSTYSDAMRNCNLDKAQMNLAVDTLERQGLIFTNMLEKVANNREYSLKKLSWKTS